MEDQPPLADLDNETLVIQAQTGNRQAFSELMRRFEQQVYRLNYRILGSAEDAADATQEAFVRAFTRLHSLQQPGAFRTWLLRLTMNLSLNARQQRPEWIELTDQYLGQAPSAEQEALAQVEAAQLQAALQMLPATHRAAVVLRDLEGFSYRECAALLNVPEGTVKGWAHRGRARLKELLA